MSKHPILSPEDPTASGQQPDDELRGKKDRKGKVPPQKPVMLFAWVGDLNLHLSIKQTKINQDKRRQKKIKEDKSRYIYIRSIGSEGHPSN